MIRRLISGWEAEFSCDLMVEMETSRANKKKSKAEEKNVIISKGIKSDQKFSIFFKDKTKIFMFKNKTNPNTNCLKI